VPRGKIGVRRTSQACPLLQLEAEPYLEAASVDLGSVQTRDGAGCSLLVSHFHKSETQELTCCHSPHQIDIFHRSESSYQRRSWPSVIWALMFPTNRRRVEFISSELGPIAGRLLRRFLAIVMLVIDRMEN